MRKLIIANWKSNPSNSIEAVKLAKSTDKKGIVITPPHVFLEHVSNTLKKSELGAQDVYGANFGPYTGETSLNQLKSFGVKYIILGHSERRKYLNESDKLIALKVKAALEAGFKVVLCVGEGSVIRRRGLAASKKFVLNQLKYDIPSKVPSGKLIIAYEPVWAISTFKGSKPDTPEGASEMIGFIKKTLSKVKPKVIYGGSVNASNAKAFLSQRVIDGALIGGVSLKPLEFQRVINDIM